MEITHKSISIVSSLSEQQWRQFVDGHPDGNIFHTPEMYEVFCQARNHDPELWAAVSGDRVLALMVPVRINLLAGLLRPLTSRAIAYGSVLYTQDQEGKEGLEKMLHTYKKSTGKSILYIELRNMANLGAAQSILESCLYSYVDYMNFLVDISLPVDQVWKNISKSAQRNITKALNKRKFHVFEATVPAQIERCYNILKKTYTYSHVPLADISLFEAALQVLRPKGMVKFLLGRVDGQDVAASVVLLYKDVIYGWYRGFDRTYASDLPNDLMVWDILKWGAENHFRTFDFGGAGRPNEEYGPRQFKAKFGGKQVNYGRNLYVCSSNLLRISKLGYEFFRHLPM